MNTYLITFSFGLSEYVKANDIILAINQFPVCYMKDIIEIQLQPDIHFINLKN